MELSDRLGGKVEPREWFLVPLPVIQQAIEMPMKGDLEQCAYAPTNAAIMWDEDEGGWSHRRHWE